MFKGINCHASIARTKPYNDRMKVAAFLLRHTRRKLIAEGKIEDPLTRPYRYQFDWSYGSISGVVFSDTTGEARALIKQNLGLPKKHRLPKEVKIIRSTNNGTTPGSTRTAVRGTAQS
jgi:hypothetical protein